MQKIIVITVCLLGIFTLSGQTTDQLILPKHELTLTVGLNQSWRRKMRSRMLVTVVRNLSAMVCLLGASRRNFGGTAASIGFLLFASSSRCWGSVSSMIRGWPNDVSIAATWP